MDACELRLGDLDLGRGVLEVDQQLHGEHAAAGVQRVPLEPTARRQQPPQRHEGQPLIRARPRHDARGGVAVALQHGLLRAEEAALAPRARLAVTHEHAHLRGER